MAAPDTFKALLGGAAPPSDAYIAALLEQADALIRGYLRASSVPSGLDAVRASLALVLFNRAGAEGESRRVEGEVTSVFESLPASLLLALRPYRAAFAPSLLGAPGDA